MQTTLKPLLHPHVVGERRSWMRLLAISGVMLAVLLVAAYLAFGYISADQLTLPPRSVAGIAPRVPGIAHDTVTFPARTDGVQIAGTYIPSASATRAVIMVHGKGVNRKQELDGLWPDLATDLQKAGFAVLMLDLRGHGDSGDGRFTFGLIERRDVLGAADYLKSRGFLPGRIGALGVSLGAASVTGAAADDTVLGALVADSMFADFNWVLQTKWNVETGYPDFLMYSTLFMSRFVVGANMMDAKPKDEIGKVQPRPILLIQGTADDAVLSHHWAALRAAAPAAEYWQIEGGKHARIYNIAREEYVRRVTATFHKMPK